MINVSAVFCHKKGYTRNVGTNDVSYIYYTLKSWEKRRISLPVYKMVVRFKQRDLGVLTKRSTHHEIDAIVVG